MSSWMFFVLRGLLADGSVLRRSGNKLVSATPSEIVAAATPAGNLVPSTTASYDLGVTGTRWRSAYLSTLLDVPRINMAPMAASSGARTALTFTGAADTGITASTEQSDVYLNLTRTVTWATGALTDQRFVRLGQPTLAFADASTVTNASVLYIAGAPVAGTNATITNSYAIFVDAGRSRFDGPVVQNDYPVKQVTGTAIAPVTTINTPMGITVVGNGATSVSVTCAACTTTSHIVAVIRNATTNNVSIRAVIPGNGSFVVHVTGDPGASTAIIGVQITQPGSGV